MFLFFGHKAPGPWPGGEPIIPATEGKVLTTEPPGKSQDKGSWSPAVTMCIEELIQQVSGTEVNKSPGFCSVDTPLTLQKLFREQQ